MDFAFTETQTDLVGLCDKILGGYHRDLAPGRSPKTSTDPFWPAMSAAGLLDVLVAEERGGAGLGATEACLVAARCGAAGVALPIGNALASRAAVDSLCATGQRTSEPTPADSVFSPIGWGSTAPSAARPRLDRSTRRLTGRALLAPAGASRLLVWATVDGAADALVELDTQTPGIECRPLDSPAEPLARYSIDGVAIAADAVTSGAGITELRRRIGLLELLLDCAELCGLAEGALRLTADYAGRRRQFNRPIGTFQAVAGRLADCYIDLEAMRWTLLRAAASYDRGAVDDQLAAVARVWACDGGDRVLAAAQHIHGGIGVDVTYPLAGYFLRTRQLLLAAGGVDEHLAALGSALTEGPVG